MSELKSVLRPVDLSRPLERERQPAVDRAGGFKDLLREVNKTDLIDSKAQAPAPAEASGGLKFSNHALERIRSRGIGINPENLSRLQGAVDKAEKKGARDSLVLMGDSAFVVSVKNKTVVTVMDRAMMKDNVFTNIDSTIII